MSIPAGELFTLLRLELYPSDLATGFPQWDSMAWRWRWRCGSSHLAPFRHPLIKATIRTDPLYTVLHVAERRADGDFVRVRVEHPTGMVTVEAGAGGVAPVYLATDGSRLFGSWDMTDLAAFADYDTLSPVAITRLLTRLHRYSHQTPFTSITRVTAGSLAHWSPGIPVTVRYPEPVAHPLPRALRRGADPVAGFARTLDRVTAEVECPEAPVAVELSGGLDSANVAVSAAAGRTGTVSAGLIVSGPEGDAQRERRDTITNRLGMVDHPVSVAAYLPFDAKGGRTAWHPHTPDGDVYREGFDAMRAALSGAGVRTVLTGYGGDEVMGLSPTERRRPAQPSTVPEVTSQIPSWAGPAVRDAVSSIERDASRVTGVPLGTLVVFAARHPRYLAAGLWPVAPYVHPLISRYGRSLPVPWRVRKNLLRTRLAHAGFGPEVTDPAVPETFTPTMAFALHRRAAALLTDLLTNSPLVDLGFLDRAALEHLATHAQLGEPLPPLTYDLLATELGIRSMCNHTTASSATDSSATGATRGGETRR